MVTRGTIPLPDFVQALYLLIFGVLQMAIPYALFARGLRTIDAPEAGLIALVEPVLNPILVLLVTGEVPARATIAGSALLLARRRMPLLADSGPRDLKRGEGWVPSAFGGE